MVLSLAFGDIRFHLEIRHVPGRRQRQLASLAVYQDDGVQAQEMPQLTT